MKERTIIIGFFLFLVLLGIAGSYDRAEEILCEVPYELYQEIINEMGGDPSEVKIAEYYLDNKTRFDSLAKKNGW